jgi:hypothetical protein
VRADEKHPATHELRCLWVQIGDQVLTAADHHLISVDYRADADFGQVVITIACSSFASVDEADVALPLRQLKRPVPFP